MSNVRENGPTTHWALGPGLMFALRLRSGLALATLVIRHFDLHPLVRVTETPGQRQRSCRGGERERTARTREVLEATPARVRLSVGGQTRVPGGHIEMLPPTGSRLRVGAGGSPGERKKIPAILDGEAAFAARAFHRDDGIGGQTR